MKIRTFINKNVLLFVKMLFLISLHIQVIIIMIWYELSLGGGKMDLESKLQELKYEYVHLQGDLEKIESTGHPTKKMTDRLAALEKEIKEVRQAIKNQ